ncbi:Cj0069 family protein [Caulobacter sp. KR2-114]|uniref:Cj0069 family protein n=1 Tax=Caulobacter sp. KR2-114 TaxID=3400912 RepID=UPI003C12122B
MAISSKSKVAILWRGDRPARDAARAESSRLSSIFEALAHCGIGAEPAVWSEDLTDEVRNQLLAMDGVLVWVDPISTATGARRNALDGLLRDVARAGVFVSTHPDIAAKMGVKAVLHRTRDLDWGSDVALYEDEPSFRAAFPARLATGIRVLKRNRGNGGIGVWKVEGLDGATVRVKEARSGGAPHVVPLDTFMAERQADFEGGEPLVDQAFQPRHLEGMVRCYVAGDRVAGFGHQFVRALAGPEDGPSSPRLYSAADDPRFQRLRALMESDWIPAMAKRLAIPPDTLPVIWDADFLLGPKTPEGDDSYVLCEINVSSVFPIPAEAPDALAETTRLRLAARAARKAGA